MAADAQLAKANGLLQAITEQSKALQEEVSHEKDECSALEGVHDTEVARWGKCRKEVEVLREAAAAAAAAGGGGEMPAPLGMEGAALGAGGAEPDASLLTALTAAPLSLEAALAFVSLPSTGAAVCFVGLTRTPGAGGRAVRELFFEAFEPMARSGLRAIAGEARARFRLSRVALLHRLGAVPVGQASLVVCASAPHRADALAALGAIVDLVKARATIFKREVYSDGSGWWVDGCSGCSSSAAGAQALAAAQQHPSAVPAPGE